jgi:hypothetical protein
MMKLLLQLIAALSISSICVAQTPVFEWARGTGSTGLDYSPSIKTDQFGNVYTTGSFNGTVDFDPGVGVYNLTSAGIHDAYIKKVDAAGNFLWAHSYGNTGGDQGTSIDIDDNGNVYVAGQFRYTVDFNSGTGTDIITSVTSIDGFILKLNANGDFGWVRTFAARPNYISYDGMGNVYTTGWYSNTVDFDPGVGVLNLTSNGSADVFVHKMDTAGNFGWVKTVGGSDNDYGRALSFDNMGNVHLVGSFKSTVDFDPGAGVLNKTSAGDNDVFIQKLDVLGNLVWVKTFGGVGSDGITGIELDNSNNIVTSGIFIGTVDFDPNLTVTNLTGTGTYASFIQKLDAAGNFQWVKGFMGTGTDYVRTYGIALDQFDNVYTVGAFNGAIDFDPNASANIISGSHAGFINKVDNNGNLDFALVVGDPGCEGISITVDLFDNILCTGGFENTSDFNPFTGVDSLINQGSSDEFILKIAQCFSTSSTINPSACDSYTSPSGNYVWTSSNTYMDTIPNASNCDSIITINLTINNASSSSITASACGSYTSPSGNVWTSSNTYMDTISNASNCDSIVTINLTINTIDTSVSDNGTTLVSNETGAVYQWIECSTVAAISGAVNASFTPLVNGNYAVVVTKNGCSDTSACYFVTVVGIINPNFETEVLLYPNPTKGDFVLDLGAHYESVNLTLTDLSGKVIETKTYQERQWLNLNLMQPAGVYLLTIKSADKKTVIKLIKN